MKRIFTAAIVLFILLFPLSAVEKDSWWGSYYMPGNLAVKGALGFEKSTGSTDIMAFSVYPEVEIVLFKPYFGGLSPIDLGVAARGHVGFGLSDSTPDSPLAAGIGVFGTFHFGFRGIGSHFTEFDDTPSGFFSQLNRFDYFFEAGPVFDFMTYDDSGLVSFGVTSGINYFIKDNLAVTLEGNWWHGFTGGGIGFVYKMGPSQNVTELDIKIKNINIDLNPMYMQIYLSQFYSIYWYSFYAGGFYFDDSNYKEGQGTEWMLASDGDKDKLIIAKSLLKVNEDASRWWKIKYGNGSDEIIYEFLIDKDYKLLKLRFIDDDSGEVREYTATPEEIETYSTADMREISESDYKEYYEGRVNIKTDAGKFETDHLVFTQDEAVYTYEWWLSDTVPGRMVKFMWKDSEESMTPLNQIDAYHTSKWCPRCGSVNPGHSSVNYALYVCKTCDLIVNSDRKASKAIAIKSVLERTSRGHTNLFVQISNTRVAVNQLFRPGDVGSNCAVHDINHPMESSPL